MLCEVVCLGSRDMQQARFSGKELLQQCTCSWVQHCACARACGQGHINAALEHVLNVCAVLHSICQSRCKQVPGLAFLSQRMIMQPLPSKWTGAKHINAMGLAARVGLSCQLCCCIPCHAQQSSRQERSSHQQADEPTTCVCHSPLEQKCPATGA